MLTFVTSDESAKAKKKVVARAIDRTVTPLQVSIAPLPPGRGFGLFSEGNMAHQDAMLLNELPLDLPDKDLQRGASLPRLLTVRLSARWVSTIAPTAVP